MMRTLKLWPMSTAAFILPFAAEAQPTQSGTAASKPTTGLEEIIVTAQRREERLQDVPIAITAIGAQRMAATRVERGRDLMTQVPSLVVSQTLANFQPRIRGVGSTSVGTGIENPIATYVDGVYIANANTSLLEFSDVQRIEVLKGPQGTLFGRNATGGLIHIITEDPTPGLGGTASVTYANYDKVRTDLTIHGGTDMVSGILSGFYSHQSDGYGTNFTTGEPVNRPKLDVGLRGKLMFTPSDRTTVKIAADWIHSDGSYPDARAPKGFVGPFTTTPVPGSVWDVQHDQNKLSTNKSGGGSLTLDQDVGALKFTSITAYRKIHYWTTVDYDSTAKPYGTVKGNVRESQFSQEIRLGNGNGSKIVWVIGGYYFHDHGSNLANIRLGGALTGGIPIGLDLDGAVKTDSYAGFGQVTVPLGDATRVTGGIRYTSERRSFTSVENEYVVGGPTIINNAKFGQAMTTNKVTFRASVDHRLSPEILLYASFNRGFKSGGYNLLTPAAPFFNPEVLDAYEAGMKGEFFDRKLRLNPAVFYYSYSDIQLPFITSPGQIGIANGAKATLYGADLDFEFVPVPNVRIFGGASYIHSRFGSYPNAVIAVPNGRGGFTQIKGDATGNRLPFTPEFSGNIGTEYSIPSEIGRFSLNGNLYYADGYPLEVDNVGKQESYVLLSASIGWESKNKRLSASIWGKNLTNSEVYMQYLTSPTGRGATYQPPRTYGVTVGTKF